MKKRILSCVLSAALLLGLTPWSALATDDPLADQTSQTEVQTDFQSPPQDPDIYADPQPNIQVPETPQEPETPEAVPEVVPEVQTVPVVQAAETVTTEEALRTAVANGGEVTLGDDITLDRTLDIPNDKEVTLDLNGHTLKANVDDNAIRIVLGATLTLKDSGTDGTITHTSGKDGRGVRVDHGKFYMYGGNIVNNKTTKSGGGGVYVSINAAFEMHGGTIANNNTSYEGGGVYINGGGPYGNGQFTMTGGVISNNTAGNGGGVYIASADKGTGGEFTMTGGTISDNTAKQYGGGVCLWGTAKFTMTGGTITGNKANTAGGGVFVQVKDCTFTVSGTPNITGNTGSNVCLPLYNNAKFTIGEGGLKSGAQIGVTLKDISNYPTTDNPVTIATGVKNGYAAGSVFPDDTINSLTVRANMFTGDLLMYRGEPPHLEHNGIDAKAQALTSSNNQLYIDGTPRSPTNNGYYELPAGSYYLAGDLTLNYPLAFTDGYHTVTLCLNGHKILANGNFDVLTIPSKTLGIWNVTLNLYDCGGDGTITHKSGSGCGVSNYGYDSTFNMYGGTISNNTTTGSGGGVIVGAALSNIFNMYGGTIFNNTTSASGGGVFMDYGTFNMYGGTITGNTANVEGGGVFVNGYGTFNLQKGTISKNTADSSSSYGYGGGIYANGDLNLSGGTITGNTATNNGGGVFTQYNHTTLSGDVQIKDNLQGTDKSNLYLSNGAAFKIGTLSSKASIGVKTDALAENDAVKIATGATGKDMTGITSDDGYKIKTIGDELYLVNGAPHVHSISSDGTDVVWKPIGTADELNAIKTAGNYYLTADIELVNNSTDSASVANVTWTPVNGVVLDLCSHNITVVDNITEANVDDIDTITVNSGVTFTLTDCKDNGQGDYGKITHNKRIDLGSGVKVNGGTFIMYGGEISGNYLGANGPIGAGVCVQNSGTFTLYDGLITKNYCSNGGSGVSIKDRDTTVYLRGGTITGNYADAYYLYSSRGSGVSVNDGTLTVSGDVQITGNKVAEDGDKFTGGTESNVYLSNGKTITIGDTLTGTIGVGTEKTLSGSSRIKIATNATEDSLKHFTIDKEDADYILVLDENALYLSAHQHGDWTYDLSDNTITVKCNSTLGTCGLTDRIAGTYTITAPASADLTYDGSAKAATVMAASKSGVTLPTTPAIQYQKKTGEPLESAPTDAGDYTASISVGGVTAHVEYTVQPKTIAGFTYNSDSLTYNGTEQTCPDLNIQIDTENGRVALKAGRDYTISGITKGTNAGTYTLQITFCGNYKCDHPELEKIEWRITPLPVTLDWHNVTDRTYGDGKTVTATVSNKYGNDDVSVTVSGGDGKNVGQSYTAAATGLTGAQAGNYTLTGGTNLTQEYTLGKKSVTIPAANTTTFTYNSAEQTYMTGSVDYTVSGNVQKNAGTHTVTVALADKANTQWADGKTDDLTYSFVIGKKSVTVKAENKTTRVGQPLATLTYTCDPAPCAGDTFTGELATDANKDTVGSQYTITQGDLSLGDNYSITFEPGTYTVTNKQIQSNFKFAGSEITKTYGDEAFTAAATGAAAGSTVSYVSSDTSVATVDNTGKVTIVGVGTATITAKASATADYEAAEASYTLTVNKKVIEEPAEDAAVYTYTGQAQTYKLAENAAYTIEGNVQTNANESGYAVTVTLKDSANTKWANHDAASLKYTFVIKKAPITITAKNQSAYIGDQAPQLGKDSYAVTGLVNGETLVTEPTVAYVSEPDMTKNSETVIHVSGAAASDNYSITYVDGKLTVGTRPSSGGGGSSTPTYPVSTPSKAGNGSVSSNIKNAASGSTVTITVKPDSGYQLEKLTVTDRKGNTLKLTDKGNGNYTFVMPSGQVDVKATFTQTADETSPYDDVSKSDYYYGAVKWAKGNNITGGVGGGLFGSDQPCTRAQIVTFLWRAAGSPAPKGAASMTDVSQDAYYAKAVAWAIENGITSGTGADQFSPDAACTRAQGVTFLYRAAGSPAVTGSADFQDVTGSDYFAAAVAWAKANDITDGVGSGLFGSKNSCTRAQIVTFLWKLYAGK